MTLPRPEHWREGMSARAVAGLVLFGVMGVVCVVWMVIVAGRGDYLTAAVMVGFAATQLGFVVVMIKLQFGWVSPRAGRDSDGTVLRPDRVVGWLFVVGAVAFIPSGVLFVRYSPTGDLDIPAMSRGQQLFFPVLVAFMVLLAVLGLGIARRKGGAGVLQLTPDRFELTQMGTVNSGSWDEVVEISDEAPPGNTLVRFPAVMIMKDGPPQVISGLAGYTPRGRALYWMIRHYWLHPENRAELTNGIAIERLRNEQFEAE